MILLATRRAANCYHDRVIGPRPVGVSARIPHFGMCAFAAILHIVGETGSQ